MGSDKTLERIVSAQIHDWKRPNDSDIEVIFGREMVDVFDYVYDFFEGKKRSDCDNPSIRHMFDVARWTKRFIRKSCAKGDEIFKRYMRLSFLHDVVEDTCDTIDEIDERIRDIEKRFGRQTADDVMLITNVYSMIINGIENNGTKERLLQGIEQYYSGLDEGLKGKYKHYFKGLWNIVQETGENELIALKKKHPLFTFKDLISLKCYGQTYIRGMIDAADDKFMEGKQDYGAAIVVKLADGIDFVRTMSPTKDYSCSKGIIKAEIKINMFEEFSKFSNKPEKDSHILLIGGMVEYLKEQLVEQVRRRKESAVNLNDDSYEGIRGFFDEEHERLKGMYPPPGRIRRAVIGLIKSIKNMSDAEYAP
ncbi:hypothetical protein COV19_01055 [Candidatus Woesearchaeota archaeon CG10_big_fil_rev_8_21_14_0_10_44_13]|nr:MAG: hypothetical protein COV19_01055 [Candidatus Woesearchaeota archaeon CG10_big_fil_rev_8_21_14_0_10_44_13]